MQTIYKYCYDSQTDMRMLGRYVDWFMFISAFFFTVLAMNIGTQIVYNLRRVRILNKKTSYHLGDELHVFGQQYRSWTQVARILFGSKLDSANPLSLIWPAVNKDLDHLIYPKK